MRAITRGFVLVGLFLLIAVTTSTAAAQQDQIPRELALALIPYGGIDGGEIIVGQVPPDLASTFILPQGGHILGSFVSLTYMQVVITLPGNVDSAAAFARRSLTDHGWVARALPTMRMGGLQYGPARNAIPTTFCKPGSPDALTVSTQFHGNATLLRLTRNMGSSICDPSQIQGVVGFGTVVTSSSISADRVVSVEQRMAGMPIASVPPLYAPNDYRASQVCRQSNGNSMTAETQSQPLRTELSLPEILAYYGKQLDSAGWKPVASTGSSVSGTWGNATNGQEVTITIAKMPAEAGCYDITLRATPRRSTK